MTVLSVGRVRTGSRDARKNSSLEGNVRRAIDIHEGAGVDESAFKALVCQAVALNSSGNSQPSKRAKAY